MFLFYIRDSEESLRLRSTVITMQGDMGDRELFSEGEQQEKSVCVCACVRTLSRYRARL